MRHFIKLLVVLFVPFIGVSQATLLEDDFESGNNWTSSGDLGDNFWVVNKCAGNGATEPGVTSLHITEGTDDGCDGATAGAYLYQNSSAGTQTARISRSVDGTCASSLVLNFDYRIEGEVGVDIAQVVYSTDNGSNWIPLGSALTSSPTFSSQTINLPGTLDASTFDIGFEFTFNNTTVLGAPLAIDNVKITGTDNVDPTITCPNDTTQVVGALCTAKIIDYTIFLNALSDNCTDSASISLIQTPAPGPDFSGSAGDVEIVTIQATDESGNTQQCQFNVTLIDVDPPVFTCLNDGTLYADANCEVIVPNYQDSISPSDNCSSNPNLVYSQSPIAGATLSGSGTVEEITLFVADESGNIDSCKFNLTLVDTIISTVTCPSDSNVMVNSTCEYDLPDFTGDVTINSNCELATDFMITQSIAPGTTIANNTSITITVTGGTPAINTSCSFNLNLVDTISPFISCGLDQTRYVDENCEYTLEDFTGIALNSDNCGSTTITQSPISGSTLNAVIQTVTLTATDLSGNSSSCSFDLTLLDTIKPTVTCPNNQIEYRNASCEGVFSDYTGLVTSNDNCSAIFTTTQSVIAGNTFLNDQSVTITVEDENGNSQTCSFNVTLVDSTVPSITCPADQTVGTNSGCDYTLADFTGATVSDNCSFPGDIVVSQNPTIGTALAVGNHTVKIFAEDEAENIDSCEFVLTVQDDVNPTISNCSSFENVYANASCEASLGDYTSGITISDNCSAVENITVVQSPAAGSIITQNTLVTITATDESGNSSTCQFNANFIDTIKPSVTCPADQSFATNASCEYTIPNLVPAVTGSDNCSDFSNMTVSQSFVAGSTGTGISNVIITLTDEAGNSEQCTVVLSPIDNTVPTITCPDTVDHNNGTNCTFDLLNYSPLATVTDNCPSFIVNQTPSLGTTVNTGNNIITLTATDAGGNTASCDFVLRVIETEIPVIVCPADIQSCDPTVTYDDPIVTDNCSATFIQIDNTGLSSGDIFPVGNTDLIYQAIDSSGNTAQCTFRVDILEYDSPAIVVEDTILLCEDNGTVISAVDPVSGTGQWTILNGGDGFINNEFASTTGVNNLPNDTTYIQWEVSSPSCGSNSDTVVIIVSQEALPSTIAADTIFNCYASDLSLAASDPIYGQGSWSSSAGVVFGTPTDNVTTVTLPSSGWYNIFWTVENGVCPGQQDSVAVLFLESANASVSEDSLCLEVGSVELNSSEVGAGQSVIWNVLVGGGVIENQTSANTTISDLSVGINEVEYVISHPECNSLSETFTIFVRLCEEFDPVIPSVITPNFDGKNDLFDIPYLGDVYPDCEVMIFNRWGSIIFESTGYDQAWDGTFKGEPVNMGTYFYRIKLNDEAGTVYKGDINVIH